MIMERIMSTTEVKSVIFPDLNKELFDIDEIFKITNYNFIQTLSILGLTLDFNFNDKNNKKLYTNEFIKTICDFLKNKESSNKIYFYSNVLTKDEFRNKLIRKIKSIFGLKILEDHLTLTEFSSLIELNDSDKLPKLEMFLNQECFSKKFKQIKKHLIKMGFIYLNDVYFQDLSNKITILH
jgi:hypothetical protein